MNLLKPCTGLLEGLRPDTAGQLVPTLHEARLELEFRQQKHCRAPQMADLGEEGRESWLELELKLVAVVGIIGMPNAGQNILLLTVITAGQLVYYAACALLQKV